MLLMGFVVGGKPTASKESIDGGNGVSWGDGGWLTEGRLLIPVNSIIISPLLATPVH